MALRGGEGFCYWHDTRPEVVEKRLSSASKGGLVGVMARNGAGGVPGRYTADSGACSGRTAQQEIEPGRDIGVTEL